MSLKSIFIFVKWGHRDAKPPVILFKFHHKEIDVIPMVLIPTVQRARDMDFTIPLLIGKNRLMLHYPEEESRLKTVVRPFSYLVSCKSFPYSIDPTSLKIFYRFGVFSD